MPPVSVKTNRTPERSPICFSFFQKGRSIALSSAGNTKAVTFAKLIATFGAIGFRKTACRSRLLPWRINGKIFIMPQMILTHRAIYIPIRVPGSKIQGCILVTNLVFAGFTSLLVCQSAAPLCSLISHFQSSFRDGFERTFPVLFYSSYRW